MRDLTIFLPTGLPRAALAALALCLVTSDAQAGLLAVGSAEWQQFEGSAPPDRGACLPPWSVAANDPPPAPGFRGASNAGGAVLVVRRDESQAWTPALPLSRAAPRVSVRSSDEVCPCSESVGGVFRPPELVCS